MCAKSSGKDGSYQPGQFLSLFYYSQTGKILRYYNDDDHNYADDSCCGSIIGGGGDDDHTHILRVQENKK